MPSTPVSISNDLTLALSIAPLMTVHDCVTVPPGALPPYIPHLELPVTVMWPPGFALMQNKLTTIVLHKMMPLALDEHDCGYMIVHVPIPPMPPNVKVLLHIAFSSRKTMFAASKVKANGTPVACTSLWFPIPMTCCANPFTLPIGTAPLNLLNTVTVGMTWLDVLFGVLTFAANAALEAFTFIKDKGKPIELPSPTDWLWKATLGDTPAAWAQKTAVGLLTSGVRLLAREDGNLQLSFGPGGYWGANVGLSRSDGVWSFGASANAGAPVLGPFGPTVGHQEGFQRTWNPDGTTTDTTTSTTAGGQSVGPGGVAAQRTTGESTTTDASGRVVSKSESSSTQVVGGEPFVGGSRVESTSKTTPTGGTPVVTSGGQQGGTALGHTWGEPL